MGPCAIEVESLRKSFGGQPALRGVSLRVEHGEMVALLGASGFGQVDAAAPPERPASRRHRLGQRGARARPRGAARRRARRATSAASAPTSAASSSSSTWSTGCR